MDSLLAAAMNPQVLTMRLRLLGGFGGETPARAFQCRDHELGIDLILRASEALDVEGAFVARVVLTERISSSSGVISRTYPPAFVSLRHATLRVATSPRPPSSKSLPWTRMRAAPALESQIVTCFLRCRW